MDRIARMHRIWDTIGDVPKGSVASYGQIAEVAGIPRGARQVGYALRHLPDEHNVPWHRIIQASGKIAFDQDTLESAVQLVAEAIGVKIEIAGGDLQLDGITKNQLNVEWDMPLDTAIEAEAQAQAICMQTEDFRRAYRAFVAKQRPKFEGN